MGSGLVVCGGYVVEGFVLLFMFMFLFYVSVFLFGIIIIST